MIEDGVIIINDDYVKWRSCVRKRRYSRNSDAQAAANRTDHGQPYFCDFCAGFHVGHVGDFRQKGTDQK
jgi:hypothetical protein